MAEGPESRTSRIGKAANFFALGWRSAFSAAIKFRLRAALAAEVPYGRSSAGQHRIQLLFHYASAFQKQKLLQSHRMARLFLEVLQHYRLQNKYLLHEFVLMPDHFHLLITPTETLERALQLIKGGFSFRARKELGFVREIWHELL